MKFKIDKDLQDIFILVFVGIIACLLLAVVTSGFGGNGGNVDKARHAVEAQGYTNVRYVGADNFACGKPTGFAFDADNVNRARVRVIACKDGGLLNPVSGWRIVTR